VRTLLGKFVSADSYGLVVVLVILTYLTSVSFDSHWAQSVVIAFQIATVWLTLRTARAGLSIRILAAAVLATVAVVAMVDLLSSPSQATLAAAMTGSALLYCVAPVAVLRDIGTRPHVDQETVLGAIAAYLIVGMFFAFAYRAISIIQPIPFFGAEGSGDLSQALFFSFVTLTTTGYGNLVPASNPGQTLAVMEAVLGQLFLVTAVAKIISAWKPRRWRNAEEPS